ncbi:MAG: hypothetical protein IPL39_08380 [Opitutaceae bacterium]|nr:hypothetical protein [Opitutaceae bacterium]
MLILVGLTAALAALRAIAGIVLFILDMRNGGRHAPEVLGALTASIVVALGLGWLWRRMYFSKAEKTTSGTVK